MDERQQAQAMSRVFLRPIATPLPLGFLALAVGTFTLAGLQLSWISPTQSRTVGLVILTFVIPLQLISVGYGFIARDSAVAAGLGVQMGGWLSIGVVELTSPPHHVSGALGLILLGAGAVMLVPAMTAAYSKLLATVVMALTSVRFFLDAAYQLSPRPSWQTAAGVAGLVLAAAALYAGLAFELEDARKATVLPTFRRSSGRKAITGGPAGELTGIHREAGIRRKL